MGAAGTDFWAPIACIAGAWSDSSVNFEPAVPSLSRTLLNGSSGALFALVFILAAIGLALGVLRVLARERALNNHHGVRHIHEGGQTARDSEDSECTPGRGYGGNAHGSWESVQVDAEDESAGLVGGRTIASRGKRWKERRLRGHVTHTMSAGGTTKPARGTLAMWPLTAWQWSCKSPPHQVVSGFQGPERSIRNAPEDSQEELTVLWAQATRHLPM